MQKNSWFGHTVAQGDWPNTVRHFCDTQIASKIASFGPFSRNVCRVGVFFHTRETHMGSMEYRINKKEIFDRICVRIVQKKRIFKRGPGDSGGRLQLVNKYYSSRQLIKIW